LITIISGRRYDTCAGPTSKAEVASKSALRSKGSSLIDLHAILGHMAPLAPAIVTDAASSADEYEEPAKPKVNSESNISL
jgi:hypothetical protein